MEPCEFPEQTAVYAKGQPEYLPLPVHQMYGDANGRIVCCWRLTWRERCMLMWTGHIWQQILTFRHPLQPQKLTIDKPEMARTP